MSLAYRKSGLDDDDREAAARFTEIDFSKTKSLTVQSPTEEVDINKIMARINKGQNVLTSQGQPFYGDVSDLGGLQEAFIKAQEAEDLFMQFPADVRERFENDPVQFVEFFENPNNMKEAVELGLVKIKPVPEPAKNPPPAVPPVGGPTQ